jgi:hypothetical protein
MCGIGERVEVCKRKSGAGVKSGAGSHSFPENLTRLECTVDGKAFAVFQVGDVFGAEGGDVVGHARFSGDFVDEVSDFVGRTHNLEFDGTVSEVFHPPTDLKAAC